MNKDLADPRGMGDYHIPLGISTRAEDARQKRRALLLVLYPILAWGLLVTAYNTVQWVEAKVEIHEAEQRELHELRTMKAWFEKNCTSVKPQYRLSRDKFYWCRKTEV